jgi:hypothetical protein
MIPAPSRPVRRVLDPYERIAEVLFGLIMVLTFTGSLSIADAGRDDVRTMLIGALGCNLAWGIIDAVLYLMGWLADQSRGRATLREIREAPNPAAAITAITAALPPLVVSVLQPAELESLRGRLAALPGPAHQPRLTREAWAGALGVFLLVFISTLPVVIPFLLFDRVQLALRVSNGIAIGLLFATGYAFGRITGRHQWRMGIGMVVLGAALVSLTMALGG